jgi:hypothetical protein
MRSSGIALIQKEKIGPNETGQTNAPGGVVRGKENVMRILILLGILLAGAALQALMQDTTATTTPEVVDTLESAPPEQAPSSDSVPPATTDIAPETPAKKPMNPIVLFMVSLVIVVGVGVGAWYFYQKRG